MIYLFLSKIVLSKLSELVVRKIISQILLKTKKKSNTTSIFFLQYHKIYCFYLCLREKNYLFLEFSLPLKKLVK